ncbi:MAG: DUF6476 family protein [Pseudomonadota bacterium]
MAQADIQTDPEEFEEPPFLRRLRLLVMVLIFVLIVGVLAIAGTIVIRLGFGIGERPVAVPTAITAEEIILPEAHEIVATGQGPGVLHLVLRAEDGSEALYVFDAVSGREISRTPLVRE